jgi:hypothetical protein
MAIEARVMCVIVAGFGTASSGALAVMGLVIMDISDDLIGDIVGAVNTTQGAFGGNFFIGLGLACLFAP